MTTCFFPQSHIMHNAARNVLICKFRPGWIEAVIRHVLKTQNEPRRRLIMGFEDMLAAAVTSREVIPARPAPAA